MMSSQFPIYLIIILLMVLIAGDLHFELVMAESDLTSLSGQHLVICFTPPVDRP